MMQAKVRLPTLLAQRESFEVCAPWSRPE
jgi:hypothetical protein